MTIDVKEASVAEAAQLLRELDEALTGITGASGAGGFSAEDVADPRSVLVIAYVDGKASGCGALRELSESTAEVKKVFARPNRSGVGSAVLKSLEDRAGLMGYTELVLETRKINTTAVAFYRKNGYLPCQNYGKYADRTDAVCFSKKIEKRRDSTA